MYERIDHLDGPIVGLRIQETISHPENQALVNLVRHSYRRFGGVRLLVVYEAELGPMGAESLYDNLRFAKEVSDLVDKMAVVGKRDWENTWIGLFGLFGGIQANYYDIGRFEEALAWLNE